MATDAFVRRSGYGQRAVSSGSNAESEAELVATASAYADGRVGDTSSPSSSLALRLASLISSRDGAFSVPDYLNTALSVENILESSDVIDGQVHDETQLLQTKMAELALQLQLETQKCHDEIERIGMEVRAALPRCEADAVRLNVGLSGMRQDASALLRDSAPFIVVHGDGVMVDGTKGGIDAESATQVVQQQLSVPAPLETLSTLHALRTNLSLTKSILSAASSWDATVSRIPSLLAPAPLAPYEGGDDGPDTDASKQLDTSMIIANLSEATKSLLTLESGARALRGMPGRDQRDDIISDFRSRIEVLLRPRLLHALQVGSSGPTGSGTSSGSRAGDAARLGPLQQISSMYGLLGKMDMFTEEYIRARPAAVHRAWFAFVSPVPKRRETYDSDQDMEESLEDSSVHKGLEINDAGGGSAIRFVEWLPGWYDTVLSLLAEERRRSVTVFGVDVAPEITARVLRECFRPLLSSFVSRLSNLFPVEIDGDALGSVGSDEVGSFEAVCAAYESTLRFLSLAYDPMLGAAAETIKEVFTNVASPFASYQRNFAGLELRHSRTATINVWQDVRRASRGAAGGGNLTALQDAVDRIADRSTVIFPLADASLNRFELLNCGYKTPSALCAIDRLITNHLSELATTITALSVAMTNDKETLAQNFDEQHVHCALEVLKVAGSFVRSLASFEVRTRDRLRNMCTGMRASIAQQGQGVADSLSILEVGFLLARSVCEENSSQACVAADKLAALTQLQRLSGESRPGLRRQSSSSLPDLFPETLDAIEKLSGTCHNFVFEVLYAVPRFWLQSMSGLPVWRDTGNAGAAVDSYSILPQSYITHVGEHILALVQALEPFASNAEALSYANEVMSGVKAVAVQSWKDFYAVTGFSDSLNEDVVNALIKGKELKMFVLNEGDETFEAEEDEEDEDASAFFCNEWLDVVGIAVTGRILERIMRIAIITPKGSCHLVADLNYLTNVFSALGIAGHPHPLLNHFSTLVSMNPEDLKQVIDRKGRESSDLAQAVRSMEMRIASMKGLV